MVRKLLPIPLWQKSLISCSHRYCGLAKQAQSAPNLLLATSGFAALVRLPTSTGEDVPTPLYEEGTAYL